MKANEFVKKFGVERAKQIVNADDSVHALVFATTKVSFLDLKRLVESHELVEKYKKGRGIRFRIRWGQFRYGDTKEYNDRLKQAIADVESCLKVDKKLEGL